jgi:hypothetical protein
VAKDILRLSLRMTSEDRCARCGLPGPPAWSMEHLEWIAVTGLDGEPGLACPSCLSEREAERASDYIIDVKRSKHAGISRSS